MLRNPFNGFKSLHASALAYAAAQDPEYNLVVHAVGRITLAELRHDYGVTRPSLLEHDKENECHDVRADVQRKFKGTRLANRDDFAGYIQELDNGRPGALPPLTFYCPRPLREDSEGGVHIERGACIIALDGETQLDALYEAESRYIAAGNTDKAFALANRPLAFVIHSGISEDDARVIIHDLNALGRPITQKELASLDSISPINQIIEAGLSLAGHTMAEVNRTGDGMGSKFKPWLTTFERLLSLTAGIHLGNGRIGERIDTFVKSYRSDESAKALDRERIEAAIVAYCNLPYNTRKALGAFELRVLGGHVRTNGPWIIEPSRIAKLTFNVARASKIRSPKDKVAAYLTGL